MLNEVNKFFKPTNPLIYLECNGKKIIIIEDVVFTREKAKSSFDNYEKIYKNQFEITKDKTGKWFIKGFSIPSTAKKKDGTVLNFYPTKYNGKDITNIFEPLTDNSIITIGDVKINVSFKK
jgi:hypothetical protein